MAANRLPRPWDSPGKYTGVGCHFLLQCMKVESESEVVQLYPTLSNPMDCSLPGSSTYGIFQARVLEWVAIAFSNTALGGLSVKTPKPRVMVQSSRIAERVHVFCSKELFTIPRLLLSMSLGSHTVRQEWDVNEMLVRRWKCHKVGQMHHMS